MNYRYVVGDEDIILSGEEHKKVLDLQTQGIGRVVFLRNGRLGINPAHIKSVHETQLLTIAQQEENDKRLQLETNLMAAQKSDGNDYVKKTHFAFFEKMKWEHGEKCVCKSWIFSKL